MLDLATKEHTAEFKSAVEKCKKKGLADNCFAVITDAFKKAGKAIFLSQGQFDLSEPVFELIELADWSTHADSTEVLSQDVVSQLTEKISIELSGVAHKWESLGYALRVTGELMKPGVYQGIRGKKARWTDEGLKKYYKTLFGKPVRIFHKSEALFRKLKMKAGEVVGHITHLAEQYGRIFYKAMVFPREAQEVIQHGYIDELGVNRKMKESLEAKVWLSKTDGSEVPVVKAWQGLGFVFTDRPAVKGREEVELDPVALARKKKMGNSNDGDPGSGTPPAVAPPTVAPPVVTPPADPGTTSQTIALSASDLQNIVKSAVEEATVELSKEIKELKDANEKLSGDLKELADVRNEARLAEITAMEEDIKKHDPDFKPAMLYDPEKASLAERESKLNIYIRGINLGSKLKTEQKAAAISLAEGEDDESWIDEVSVEMYGKPFKDMLASPPVLPTGGSGE